MQPFDTMTLVDMTDWDVTQVESSWVARINHYGFVRVMPAIAPWTLAVDATLEFMDRLRQGRIPETVDNPNDLMDMCVQAARRRR